MSEHVPFMVLSPGYDDWKATDRTPERESEHACDETLPSRERCPHPDCQRFARWLHEQRRKEREMAAQSRDPLELAALRARTKLRTAYYRAKGHPDVQAAIRDAERALRELLAEVGAEKRSN